MKAHESSSSFPSGDFNIDDMLPPNPETRERFELVLKTLENIPGTDFVHSKDVQFVGRFDNDVPVAIGLGSSESSSEVVDYQLTLVTVLDGEEVSFGGSGVVLTKAQADELSILKGSSVEEGLGIQGAGEWLREVVHDAILVTDNSLRAVAVEHLLKTAPAYPTHESSIFWLPTLAQYGNGARLRGVIAKDTFTDGGHKYVNGSQSVTLELADGSLYEYMRSAEGEEKLYSKGGDNEVKVEPAVGDSDTYESGLGDFSLWGDAKMARELRVKDAERDEADEAGSDKVIEGSLRKFTELLEATVRSGQVSR